MIRRCAWCRRYMGEKCPRCGSLEIVTPFRQGLSTHGVCDACLAEGEARVQRVMTAISAGGVQ